jgi:transcriptional regulator with XRE-family HTH domain
MMLAIYSQYGIRASEILTLEENKRLMSKWDNSGHPLRLWRKRHNLTYQEMADRCGLSIAFLHKLEIRTKNPGLDSALMLVIATCGELGLEDFLSPAQYSDYSRFRVVSTKRRSGHYAQNKGRQRQGAAPPNQRGRPRHAACIAASKEQKI